MNNSLVSVIVPTFNRAHCLSRAVDSALAQTHDTIQVVIVDDGSTDETRALVASRYGDDRRVLYYRQENLGVSVARNQAMALARGEYIAFLDSDDYWEPWKLEMQTACFQKFPDLIMIWSDMKTRDAAGVISRQRFLRTMYGAYRWFSNETLFTGSAPLSEIVPTLKAQVGAERFWYGEIYSAMLMGSLVHTSTVLMRRTAAEENAGFNPEYPTGEDYDYHIRTCKLGPVGLADISTIEYQVDLPDRLTRPALRLPTAVNFLKVVQRELAQETDRVTLSETMRRELMADAFSWIGYEYLSLGDTRQAKPYLLKALTYKPWEPQTLRHLAAAVLPGGLVTALRGIKRRASGSAVARMPEA